MSRQPLLSGRFTRRSSITNKLPHVAPATSSWRHSQNLRSQFRFAAEQQPQHCPHVCSISLFLLPYFRPSGSSAGGRALRECFDVTPLDFHASLKTHTVKQ